MNSEREGRDDSLEDIRQEHGTIIAEHMVRQQEIMLQQDTVIAAIADRVLKLPKFEGPEGPSDSQHFNTNDAANVRHSIKLDFPRFTDDGPEGWQYQAEEYFAFHGVGEDSKVQITGFHMTSKTLSWIRGLRRNKLLTTWSRFVEDLCERFGTANFKDRLEDLSRLQQTSAVVVYLERFEEFLNEIEGQSENTLITYFVGRLRSDIKSEMKIMKPTTLRQAFTVAKIYETHSERRQTARKALFKPNQGGSGLPPLLKNPPNTNQAVPVVRKTLMIEEHRARSARGLCFNCDKAYAPGHRCKGHMFRLDVELGGLVEMCEEPSDQEENVELITLDEGETEISLQALSGTFNPRTL